MRVDLPVDRLLPQLTSTLSEHGVLVLHAPTGAGKTTRVPPALLSTVQGTIVVLEPRRVAARAAARRMASELGESVGQTVGYQVRHDRQVGPHTRIVVVTEGVLLRRLVSDPFLEGIGAVIFDEFHERRLDADLALALVAQLRSELRPELAVVVMSATLDTGPVARFLQAPVLRSEGRSFPVEHRYLTRPDSRPLEEQVADAARSMLAETGGDVLVFLPGVREIERAADALRGVHAEVLALHGRLPPAEQDRALAPGKAARIVLATNVAETSVTLPGVRAVVDTGLVRQLSHDPRRGLDRLDTVLTSRASADQRAGRAGRVGPGLALRLWTERQHGGRSDHDAAEITRVSLEGPLLALMAWGEPDPRAFPWFERPPERALDAALELLDDLGAIEHGVLTSTGSLLAGLPLSPRLGRVLLEAHRQGVGRDGALATALLAERLPFARTRTPPTSSSDLLDLLDAVHGSPVGWRPRHRGALAEVKRAARQLEGAVRSLGRAGPPPASREEALRRSVLAGFPDRVALRRGDSQRLLLATGRGAELGRDCAVRDASCLVALDLLDRPGAEAVVHLASAADAAWLPSHSELDVRWHAGRDRVVATRVLRYRALELERQDGVVAPDAAIAEALLVAARANPAKVLPPGDADANRLLARLRFLARVRPDLDLPDGGEEFQWLLAARLVHHHRSLADLRAGNWASTLLDALDWSQRQLLDREAPERLRVPSGSMVRLDYPDEGPPVLAVRMQELFGSANTPRVAGQPVLLHLLAPNRRPQQVTNDLAGFWERTWPEVRNELRRRYPKHAWPEDPLTAPAERRPRRRR